MKKCLLYLFSLLLYFSCRTADPEAELSNFLMQLKEHEEQYLPDTSKQLIVFDSIYQKNRLHFAKTGAQKLLELDTLKLSPSSLLAYKKARTVVGQYLEDLETQQIYQKHPDLYHVGPHLRASQLNFDSLHQENYDLFEKNLSMVAPFYETAKSQLQAPAPEKIGRAIQLNKNTYFYLSQQLIPKIKNSNFPSEQKAAMSYSLDEARLAIKDYIAFCKSLEFEHFNQHHATPTQ